MIYAIIVLFLLVGWLCVSRPNYGDMVDYIHNAKETMGAEIRSALRSHKDIYHCSDADVVSQPIAILIAAENGPEFPRGSIVAVLDGHLEDGYEDNLIVEDEQGTKFTVYGKHLQKVIVHNTYLGKTLRALLNGAGTQYIPGSPAETRYKPAIEGSLYVQPAARATLYGAQEFTPDPTTPDTAEDRVSDTIELNHD